MCLTFLIHRIMYIVGSIFESLQISDEPNFPPLISTYLDFILMPYEKIYGKLIPYSADDKRLFKIGVNYDSKQRTIGEWIIREE